MGYNQSRFIQSGNYIRHRKSLTRTGNTNAAFGKPKAVVKPKTTALENKPFIAKGVGTGAKVSTTGSLSYGVGDRVKHIKYGMGTVKNIEPGPRDYQVTVEFDGAGQKVMYAAFAKLKKMD